MAYNLTNYTDANTVLDVAIAANDLVDGWLFVFIAVMILIVSFMAMKNYGTKEALLSSSFISFLLIGVLRMVELVSDGVLLGFFVVFLFALAGAIITD
jgi:hypothetical protein